MYRRWLLESLESLSSSWSQTVSNQFCLSAWQTGHETDTEQCKAEIHEIKRKWDKWPHAEPFGRSKVVTFVLSNTQQTYITHCGFSGKRKYFVLVVYWGLLIVLQGSEVGWGRRGMFAPAPACVSSIICWLYWCWSNTLHCSNAHNGGIIISVRLCRHQPNNYCTLTWKKLDCSQSSKLHLKYEYEDA